MAGDERPTRGDPVVHPSAVLGSEVELDDGVEIGPFCYLDGRVRVGAGTRIVSHVTILGDTEIGRDNVIHPNVVIGDEPQDVSYTGGPRSVRIGDRNIFREGVTVHRGSEHGEVTIVGDDNFFMQNSHAAHDCRIGDSTIIAGGALLAGWVEVGDRALISGNCVVHQFVRIGRLGADARIKPHQPRHPPVLYRGRHPYGSRHQCSRIAAGGLEHCADHRGAQSLPDAIYGPAQSVQRRLTICSAKVRPARKSRSWSNSSAQRAAASRLAPAIRAD